MERKSCLLFGILAILLMLSGILVLIPGVYQYNLDPNRLAYAYHRNDGLPSANSVYANSQWQNSAGRSNTIQGPAGATLPNSYGDMFSCIGIMNSFYRNESFKYQSGCAKVRNELAVDTNGDGTYGDSKGYVYPGAPDVIQCATYIPPNSEVCTSPIGCPAADELKYTGNGVYASYLFYQCAQNAVAMAIYVIAGIFLFFAGLSWLVWANYEFKDNRNKVQGCGLLSQALTVFAFIFTVSAGSDFYSASAPASEILRVKVDCTQLSQREFYTGSITPADKCLVTNNTCDPYDFGQGSGYFSTATTETGTCDYIASDGLSIRCEAALDGLGDLKSTPIENCEAVDCEYENKPYGASYTSKCCIARRKCCGDDAECDVNDICQWNATFTKSGATTTNVCFNRFTVDAFECNDKQRKAFEARLRNDGKCVTPFRGALQGDYINGNPPQGTSDQCKADRKLQLVEAAVYFAANSQDENINKLTRKIVEDNLPECLVQTIFTDCYTDCVGQSAISCPLTLPFTGAPSNCTFVGGTCVPNKGSYADAAVQKARPMEYCESLYDGTDDNTIAASKSACLATDTCYWANVMGKDRCLSKSCAGVPGNGRQSAYGYQPSQNPPCFAGDSLANDYIPPTYKICTFPEKGCTVAEQSALCATTTAVNPSYYYSPNPSGTFNPGPVFSIAECQVATVANCTQHATQSGVPCVLVKGKDGNPSCSSVYSACTDGSNVKNQYFKDLALAKESKAAVDSVNICYNDQTGQFIAPLIYDLYLCRVFFTIGMVFAFVSIPVFLLFQPIFLYMGK